MPHLKLSKNMLLGQKNWKKTKIATHMGKNTIKGTTQLRSEFVPKTAF
jgi:hypothetical protein